MSDLSRTWTVFALEAEVDAFGVSRITQTHNAARKRIAELEAENAALRERIAELKAEKNGAYWERNNLVAALARIFPSGLRRTDIPEWSADWHGCCTIDLPTGQISYHYHDSHAHLFDGLPAYSGEWDGHDKVEVHRRLAALARKP